MTRPENLDELVRKQACEVLEEEFEYLHHDLGSDFPRNGTPGERENKLRELVHSLQGDKKRTALCFSGGGIRSATFCLGVLQGLARSNWLGRFHYLSTVSGGGYIGSWLSSWICRENFNQVLQNLATTRAGAGPEPEPIQRLRAYSNYLSPVWGLSIDFLTLIATFLRNLVLNWSVLVPLLAAVLILPRIHLAVLGLGSVEQLSVLLPLVPAVLLVWAGIAYVVADLPGQTANQIKDHFPALCFSPIFGAAVVLSWIGIWHARNLLDFSWIWFLGVGAAVHIVGVLAGVAWRRARGLLREKSERWDWGFVVLSGAAGGGLVYWAARKLAEMHTSITNEALQLYATFSVPVLLGFFSLATIVYQGLARRITSEDDREWWARSGAWWLGASAVWILGFVLVIYGPQWVLSIPWLSHPTGPEALGVGGGILGIVTGLIGYWSKNGATLARRARGVLAAMGVRLLDLAALVFTIILLLTVSYAVSWGLTITDSELRKEVQTIRARSQTDALESAEKTKEQRAGPESAATATEAAARATEAAAKATEATPTAREPLERATGSAARATESAAMATESAATMMQPAPKVNKSVERDVYAYVLHNSDGLQPTVLALVLLAIGIGMSFFIGANTFSLHSMYGNRLVRAYLGATRKKRQPHWFTGFDPADNLYMKDLDNKKDKGDRRLFHVVNIALNLVRPSGGRLEWQQRKAASFTVSPLHAGSANVGYLPTSSYSGKNGVSLGRALAISGAAASPNMGYHTSSVVAFAMAFFNIRLGWWLPNPGRMWREQWPRSEPRLGFEALIAEALARTTDNSPFVYLSDGGHFENLGLYEMVKRRCHGIVVVDAGCDPKFQFEDLENAVRKIRVDLGISIEFRGGLPTPDRGKANNRHFVVGTIRYSEADGKVEDGRIIYVKPNLTGDEPIDVARYAAANRDPKSPFPHQSTKDQFFDEAQFESYRMLGCHSVETKPPTKDGADQERLEKKQPERQYFPDAGVWPEPEAMPDYDDKSKDASPPCPPPCKGGGSEGGGQLPWRSLSDSLMSWGGGALVAAGITVGVTGTLALQPGGTVKLEPGAEVAIKKEDMDRLGKGIPVTLSPRLEELLNSRVEALVNSVNKLSDALERGSPAESGLSSRIRDLAQAVIDLAKVLPARNDTTRVEAYLLRLERIIERQLKYPDGNLVKDVAEIKTLIRDIKNGLVDEGVPRLKSVADRLQSVGNQLDQVNRTLKGLDDTITKIGPRRNVRGGSEGGPR